MRGLKSSSELIGADLHYTVTGNGPPILLLHGFGANNFTWHGIIDSLALTNRVFALELKGFGQSPKPKDGKYAIEDQVNLVTQFIAHHDLHHLTLIGHSLGGAVALLTALKARENICSMVLIDSIAYDQPLPLFVRFLRLPILGSTALNILPEEFQTKMILRLVYHDHSKISHSTIEAYSNPLKEPDAKEALVQTAKSIIPNGINDLTALYPTIDVPTLLIWGQYDEIVPFSVAQRLVKAIPKSQLVTIPDVGHAPQEELPQKTFEALSEFLSLNSCRI